MNIPQRVTPEEYQHWKDKRLRRIEDNINKSIVSLEKLDKSQRFVFDAQELIYFLEGLRN